MINYLWCSPHTPTEEQLESLNKDGKVIYLSEVGKDILNEMSNLELGTNVTDVIDKLLVISRSFDATIVQPAGSPYFQFELGRFLGILQQSKDHLLVTLPDVLYSHSKRVSKDIQGLDGIIKKISYFKHEGWLAFIV